MSRSRLLLLGVLLAVGIGFALLLLRGGDEARLRRMLHELAEQMDKGDTESLIAAASRAERIASRFAEQNILIHVEGAPEFGGSRDDIKAAVYQFRSQVQSLELSILDLATEVAPGGAAATQRFTAHAHAVTSVAEDHGVRDVRVDWVKADGEWRIQSVEATEGLKRIP